MPAQKIQQGSIQNHRFSPLSFLPSGFSPLKYLPLALLLALPGCDDSPRGRIDPDDHVTAGWPSYGGDAGGSRYSPLTQVGPTNVGSLQVAWTYHTGDLEQLPSPLNLPAFEATPILAGDALYLCSPLNKVIALDAQTGVERWHHTLNPDTRDTYLVTCRGVSYYEDQNAAQDTRCRARIFSGTMDGRLVALDAASGQRCDDFGDHGELDLKKDAGGEIRQGEYVVTSAPTIVGDLVVTGALVVDNARRNVASGVVRAFDAHTGALRWAWDPVPPERAQSADSYTPGSPNAWAPFAVDPERRLLFVPTGNPANDLYAAERRDLDHYGSAVVALDADTGKVVWSFQTVHRDMWDYDVGSQPVLFDFPGPDGPVPALAQATKQGFIFVLDRVTGKPLLPIEERAVPQGGAAPDAVAPTQPYPTVTEPIVQERLTEDDMWGFTWFDRHDCVKQFREASYQGRFTPLGTQPTIQYPGNNGGVSWGSVSWDPVRKLLITNAARVPAIVQLLPRATADAQRVHDRMEGEPYGAVRKPMLSFLGAPCNRPPWGVLAAYDMTTGKRAWEVPLGTTRDVAPWPLWFDLGVPNQGGSLVTASGLTFIGAATDGYLRAFDTASGKELWKGRLPAGGQATPMTYRLDRNGKQFVVIAAGGHKYLRTKLSDTIVAYALPE